MSSWRGRTIRSSGVAASAWHELVDEPWVLPLPDQPYGTVVAEAFRAHGLQVPPFVVGSTLPVRTTLLATGRFLSMVPRVVMQFPPKNRLLRSLPIALPTTTRPLALLTLKNRTLNPLAELFSRFRTRGCDAGSKSCMR